MIRAGLLSIALLGACGVGEDPTPNPTDRQCTAALNVTGTFVQGSAPPLNNDGTAYEGCWPVGTWTFSATIMQNDCSPAPVMLPSYSFKGSLVADPDTGDMLQQFDYLTDPAAHTIIHVSAAGNKACEGELTIYSNDYKNVWTLKPWLDPGTAITGSGEYAMYSNAQTPQ